MPRPPRSELRATATPIDLGIAAHRVPLHSHLAFLWETEAQLAVAAGFVEAGLRGSDHCIVVGSSADNQRVAAVLAAHGLDVEGGERGRLVLVERAPAAEAMLHDVSAAWEAAAAAGALMIRLLASIGWDRASEAPDAELCAWEVGLAAVAEAWPCVVLCMHEVRTLNGSLMRHGVLATHSAILDEGGVLANPFFVPLGRSPDRLAAIVADLSRRQQERQALRQRSELLQAIFDHIPLLISTYDLAGRLLFANREWQRVLGWTVDEAQRIDFLAEIYPNPTQLRRARDFIQASENRWADFTMRTRDGRVIEVAWGRMTLSDGTRIGFGRDITERKRTEERLRQSHAELRALSGRLRSAREEESTRIAREVHDEVGQMLTALRLDVAWLERRLPLPPQRAGEEIRAKLRAMGQLLESVSDVVQRIATELRPGVLDKLGLEAAVEWYVGEFGKRTGISCHLQSSLRGKVLDPGPATALFRILQEALTNVARHAGATEVRIRLAVEGGRVLLAVADNGRGIAAGEVADAGSLGLIGMRERAQELGGEAVIGRDPAGGTRVEVTLP